MRIESLYVTQTAVISLFDVPLEIKENIRSAFNPIFNNKKCFEAVEINTSDMRKNERHNNMPFISNMGQLRFYEEPVNFFAAYSDYEEFRDTKIFGYDKNLIDQRMNFLCFEIHRSFKMLAQYDGKTMASGKFFLHIYPTGYIVIHLAVYMRGVENTEIKTEKDILDLIHETKPWLDGKWQWKSRFGCCTLRKTFDQVLENISLSLLTEGKLDTEKLEWKAGAAMKTDLYNEEVRKAIMSDKMANCFVEFRRSQYDDTLNGILVAKKRIHYYFADTSRERSSVLHSFWKINHICEFVLYKSKVYSDYLNYIQKDMNKMRELTLNKKYKFDIANIFGKNFYRSTLFQYTQVLDEFVKILGAKYRAMYALFSEVDGFNEKRAKFNHALEEWENDITAWQSKDTGLMKLLSLLWKIKGVIKVK